MKPYFESDGVVLYCGDCRDVLPTLAAGSVDACVTDPPYGIGEARGKNIGRGKLAKAKNYGFAEWDDEPPAKAVLDVIRRVSKEQVIFGANHFADRLPASPSWIVWDKDNSGDFADCELAWTSHDRAVRKIKWRWNGMLQENMGRDKEFRWHPTQKPLGLMLWVIENYTDPGSLVADFFMGSGTTGVACVNLGRKFVGVEIEERYVEIAVKRIKEAQNRLFK